MTGRPFDPVARLLLERAGLAIEPTRYERVEQASRRAMAQAGIADPDLYARRLAEGTLPLEPLLDEVTVGETYFFRDLPHYEVVARDVIPSVRGQPLRAWSAGCSSGEEAYSLAILFEREGVGTSSRVLGTDISPAALARAREGLYRPWSLRGPGAAWARPWLHEEAGGLRLAATIRARVEFRLLNLAADPYPTGQHLIFCRNVLIYFGREEVARVAARLLAALAPGGWLVTGPSDPPLAPHAPFDVLVRSEGIFYRRQAEKDAGHRPVRGRLVFPRLEAARVARERQAATPSPPQRRAAAAPASAAGAKAVLSAATRTQAQTDGAQAVTETPARTDGAQAAFSAGSYGEAARLAGEREGPAAAALRIRALANQGDLSGAVQVAEQAIAHHPFATELVHLLAVLLAELGREAQALDAVRSLLYLDGSLAMGHLLRAHLLRRRGDVDGARRSLRKVRDLCAAQPGEAAVPLSDGETAGRLRREAERQLAMLEARGG